MKDYIRLLWPVGSHIAAPRNPETHEPHYVVQADGRIRAAYTLEELCWTVALTDAWEVAVERLKELGDAEIQLAT